MIKSIKAPVCYLAIFLLVFLDLAHSGVINKITEDKIETENTKSESQIMVSEEDNGWIEDLVGTETIKDDPEIMSKLFRGFEVSENALGDMNQDGFVNIWDLLRIRNICLDIGDPASAYEEEEGDLDQSMVIDYADAYDLCDALIQKIGIPHIVDSDGGMVVVDGISLTIPPEAANDKLMVSVRNLSEMEFNYKHGIESDSYAKQGVYFMAAIELKSSLPFYTIPLNFEIAVHETPLCEYMGFNGLFSVREDNDGDGIAEFEFVHTLHPNSDSTALVTDSIIQLNLIERLTELNSNDLNRFTALNGQKVTLLGSGFNQGFDNLYEIEFFDLLYNRLLSVPSIMVYEDSIAFRMPMLPSGDYEARVRDIVSGIRSEYIDVTIISIPIVPEGDRDSLFGVYFSELDSLMLLGSIIADSIIINGLRQEVSDQLNHLIDSLAAMVDSMHQIISDPATDIGMLDLFASLIENMGSLLSPAQIGKNSVDRDGLLCELLGNFEDLLKDPPQYVWDQAVELHDKCPDCVLPKIMFISAWYLQLIKEIVRPFRDDYVTDYNFETIKSDCDPPPAPPGGGFHGPNVDGGTDSDGKPWTDGCCINIFKYGENLGVAAVGGGGGASMSIFVNSETNVRAMASIETYSGYNWRSSLAGSIVKVNNLQLPYNVVGVINNSGRCIIPHVPLNRDIVLSMYNPKTGHYDDTVASFMTYTEPGRWYMPLVIFNPDTSVVIYPMNLGEPKLDTVSAEKPRFEYKLAVGEDLLGDTINIGFGSEENLTLWLQDPDDEFIIRDSSLNCRNIQNFVIDKAGTYKFTITYGVSGGDGPFTVGIDNFPYMPTNCICDTVSGILALDNSPYELKNNFGAPFGDSLVSEDDVVVNISQTVTQIDSGYIEFGRLNILSGGVLNHIRGLESGVSFSADTVDIQSGGQINVYARGYRGKSNEGWGSSAGETYPGFMGATAACGGSHGGYGGSGTYGGSPGDCLDDVSDPHMLGPGGGGNTNSTAPNGGGLVKINVDVAIINGDIYAHGGNGWGNNAAGGGAGGSINITTNEISGYGKIYANGGNGGTGLYDNCGGGGGGRIAIRWQNGSIDDLDIKSYGGNNYFSGQRGGSGTIYLLGPDDTEGRVWVNNIGRNGAATPLLNDKTNFNSASIENAAKFTIGAFATELSLLDSVVISGSNTELRFDAGSAFTVPYIFSKSSSKTTLNADMTLDIDNVFVDGSAQFLTYNDFTFAYDTCLTLTNGGIFETRNNVTVSLPRFAPNNIISGTFKNWGILNVASDSIVINTGAGLEENGSLGTSDSIGYMQIYGTLSHAYWKDALSYDNMADSGLNFGIGQLDIQSGGQISVYARGYRGKSNEGWGSSAGETYPGFTGATAACGGSHGGYGGSGTYGGSPGEIYDSETDPIAFGAGGGGNGNSVAPNGGGMIRLNIGSLYLNGGSIYANGGNGWGNNAAGGGAGGSINLSVGYAAGSGLIQARGGNGGTGLYDNCGGGGGGRVSVKWQTGDISGWTINAPGGSGYFSGTPGNPGTAYTEQVTKSDLIGSKEDQD